MRNLALLVASTLLALALGEAAIRFGGYLRGIDYGLYLTELTDSERLPRRLWLQPADGFVGPWRHYPPFRPGAQALVTTSDFGVVYAINDRGLRDGAHDYARTPGVARVVAHGDSFTFGVGVPEEARFTEVAERGLGGVEIVNMGVPGYGLDHVLLSHLAEGHRYAPDLVVVFVNVHVLRRDATRIVRNGVLHVPADLRSVLDEPGGDADTAYLRSDDPLFARRNHRLLRHSHLISYLDYRLQVWRLRDRLREDDAREWNGPRPLRIVDPPAQDRSPERRRRARLILTRLADECRRAGCRVLVVNIDQTRAFPYLRNVPDVSYVDLSGELHRLGKERRLTFVYDLHYAPETHAWLGERLAGVLRDALSRRAARRDERPSPSSR